MASVFYLHDDALHMEEDIVNKYLEYTEKMRTKFNAAIKIQKVWRGYVARKHNKNLNKIAVIIQKNVRGWLLRYRLPDLYHELYDLKLIKLFNKCATVIQSAFKGFQVRSQFSTKRLIIERKEVNVANYTLAVRIRKEHTARAEPDYNEMKRDAMYFAAKTLFDRHHLVSTKIHPGVLRKDRNEESKLENYVKSVKWIDYMKGLKTVYYAEATKTDDKHSDLICDQNFTDVKKDTTAHHAKRFNLNVNIKPSKMVPPLNYRQPYEPPIKSVIRTEEKHKQISKTDFSLNINKKVKSKQEKPPYYIDFWQKKCSHNV